MAFDELVSANTELTRIVALQVGSLSETVVVSCHCDPEGKSSSDYRLGRATKDRVKAMCSACNNDFCRDKTKSSNIKNYACQTK